MQIERLFKVLVSGGAALGSTLGACGANPRSESAEDGVAGSQASPEPAASGADGAGSGAGGMPAGDGSDEEPGTARCAASEGVVCQPGVCCCWIADCLALDECCKAFCG